MKLIKHKKMNTVKFSKILQTLAGVLLMVVIVNCSSDSDSGSGQTDPTPVITVAGNIDSFGAVNALSHSDSQSIQVSASDLTANLLVKATSSFKVSLDDVSFANQVSIEVNDANSSSTMVYVRFSPIASAVGVLSGTLSFESAQAVTRTVNLSGESISITPIINVDGVIENFGDVTVMQNSVAQTITINGDNLDADIVIAISAGFEISFDDSIYSSSLQIPEATANEDTLLYVRFSPSSLGVNSGTLTLSNVDTDDVVLDLEGNGIAVAHNYTTFNEEPLAFGGGFSQSASQVFNLHTDLTNIAQIKMYLQIDCPSTGCDDWDRFANIKVKDPSTGNWFEIGRYITPYWVGTQLLDRGLEFDVTDFKSLLVGATEIRIYIENWTAKADLITLDFDYIEGTPDYPYYAVSEVLGYHANSIDGVPYGVSHSFDLDKQITVPANAESTHLRTTISGWGHATPNDSDGRPCAEWCYRTHDVKIDGVTAFSHDLGPIGCASNPINNQSPGNWTPDRAGWCPGMAVPTRIDDFGTTVSGSMFTFEYDFEDWTSDMSGGSAYYATSTYVVVKSNSAITAPMVID